MARILVAGFSHSQGIGKTGKPYDMANLHHLAPIRGWDNERGKGVGVGYESGDRERLPLKKTPELVEKLAAIEYPALLEIITEPHPDDPLRNIVADIKLIRSLAMTENK
ncbi:hypothetical protein [Enterovibrio paralichthyis]|uniref:hypothetical protein n=1 Tax=Enterovibrio paralichthyis TaxID=2853805 RepID=UPI001C467E85|nr:hypothetical protein [Enterovibrio paralichthyis]MBV7296612.1 hypothetical protein [Enterovibrio paralichthyis]